MYATIEQVTSGPKSHFFGYIGHALTIPWNASGRHIVALRTGFHDRMPRPGETADIVLIDTADNYRVLALDQTRAWNLQQGTMLSWNPDAADAQFLFNDLDPETGAVFTVLYDIVQRRRVREYRFGGESVANGGVSPKGKYFAAANYGRISRSREIISYAGAGDATQGGPANPETDGLFRVDIATGERRLLVSCAQLQDLLLNTPKNRAQLGDPDRYPLYAHHTLWSRDGAWIFFVVRGEQDKRPNAGCVVRSDGTSLSPAPFSGHPEWVEGARLALPAKEPGYFHLYDVAAKRWDGRFGGPGVFPDTHDDNALSPDGRWFVGSHKPTPPECVYTLYRLSDGAWFRTPPVRTKAGGGVCRVDPAPCWNRTSDALLVPGLAEDGSRQLFLVRLRLDENQAQSNREGLHD